MVRKQSQPSPADYSRRWTRIKLRYALALVFFTPVLVSIFQFHSKQDAHGTLSLLRLLAMMLGCYVILRAEQFRCPRCGSRFAGHPYGGMYFLRGGGANKHCQRCHLPKWAKHPPDDGWSGRESDEAAVRLVTNERG